MRPLATTAVLLLAAGCASAQPHGLVRVDLAGPQSGPGSPQELQLTDAVRHVAYAGGLVCQEGMGATLLRCSAGAVGNQSHGITIGLVRSGTGYEVSVDQTMLLPGGTSQVCSVQRRVMEQVDMELAAPVTRVDTRSDCKAN